MRYLKNTLISCGTRRSSIGPRPMLMYLLPSVPRSLCCLRCAACHVLPAMCCLLLPLILMAAAGDACERRVPPSPQVTQHPLHKPTGLNHWHSAASTYTLCRAVQVSDSVAAGKCSRRCGRLRKAGCMSYWCSALCGAQRSMRYLRVLWLSGCRGCNGG